MSDPQPEDVEGIDVPIVKLTPLHKREVSQQDYDKLQANLKAVGLREPLLVRREGDQYFILDGYIRYKALVDLGVGSVSCQVLNSQDPHTV